MKIGDIVVGTLLILLGIHVYHVSGSFTVLQKVIFGGPEFFPRLISVLMALCGVLLIANALRGKALSRRTALTARDIGWVLSLVFLLAAYVVLIQALGFLSSTSIFLLVFLILVRERRPLIIAAMCFLVPLVIFLFFEKLMGIPLPEGLLF